MSATLVTKPKVSTVARSSVRVMSTPARPKDIDPALDARLTHLHDRAEHLLARADRLLARLG